MTEAQIPEAKLEFDGKEYLISELSPELQKLISFYSQWEAELGDAKVEVFKLEAALRGVTTEIEFRLKKELSEFVPPQ